jgi:hypothetical protein
MVFSATRTIHTLIISSYLLHGDMKLLGKHRGLPSYRFEHIWLEGLPSSRKEKFAGAEMTVDGAISTS